jgi:hypothetical protein
MVDASTSAHALATSVAEIVRDVLDRLAPSSAALSMAERNDGRISITLQPTRSSAAPATLLVDLGPRGERGVTLLVGSGSDFEISYGRTEGEGKPGFEQELREAVSAVLRGDFVETLWVRHGKVVDVKGELKVGDEFWCSPQRITFLPRWLLQHERRVVRYSPYFETAEREGVSQGSQT